MREPLRSTPWRGPTLLLEAAQERGKYVSQATIAAMRADLGDQLLDDHRPLCRLGGACQLDDQGQLAGRYRQTHLWSTERRWATPGFAEKFNGLMIRGRAQVGESLRLEVTLRAFKRSHLLNPITVVRDGVVVRAEEVDVVVAPVSSPQPTAASGNAATIRIQEAAFVRM